MSSLEEVSYFMRWNHVFHSFKYYSEVIAAWKILLYKSHDFVHMFKFRCKRQYFNYIFERNRKVVTQSWNFYVMKFSVDDWDLTVLR